MTLRIMPHGRLQEWVAEEKGYFKEEGLDYVFVEDLTGASRLRDESGQVRFGAYHQKAVPERYRELVDVGTFGPGERIVFLPYTGESYESTQEWIKDRRLFGDRTDVPAYGDVVLA